MSDRSKRAIRWVRRIQLGLRVLQAIGALGILALMIILTNVAPLTAWVMRITAGVVAVHCIYSAIHHSRPARARTPASSAAYQTFSCVFDMAIMPLYAFGALAARNQSDEWTSMINNQAIVNQYLIPSFYYALIGAGGLHLLTFANGLYLCFVFYRITKMPPDMNPLEDHLTSRGTSRHKRNKSSIATYNTISVSGSPSSRLSTPTNIKHRSNPPFEDSSAPKIPFMHTRGNSSDSKRDSRLNLPSRQYQIQPGNSVTSLNPKCQYAPSARANAVSQYENDALYPSSRPSTASIENTGNDSDKRSSVGSNTPRLPKFTEAWYTSDSLIGRTAKRAAREQDSKTYSALKNHYELEDQENIENYESESGDESTWPPKTIAKSGPEGKGAYAYLDRQDTKYNSNYMNEGVDMFTGGSLGPNALSATQNKLHPNPLGQHPLPRRTIDEEVSDEEDSHYVSPYGLLRGPSTVSALSEVDLNDRRISGPNSGDIVDAGLVPRPLSEHIKNNRASPPLFVTPEKASQPPASSFSSSHRLYSIADPITGPGAVTGRLSPYTTNITQPKRGSPSKLTHIPTNKKSSNINRQRNRDSSIQPEEGLFVTRPYNETRSATPPIIVGSNRQVSSGNDYYHNDNGMRHDYGESFGGVSSKDLGTRETSSRYYVGATEGAGGSVFGRRNVSGKIAEEGRARWSRYAALNND